MMWTLTDRTCFGRIKYKLVCICMYKEDPIIQCSIHVSELFILLLLKVYLTKMVMNCKNLDEMALTLEAFLHLPRRVVTMPSAVWYQGLRVGGGDCFQPRLKERGKVSAETPEIPCNLIRRSCEAVDASQQMRGFCRGKTKIMIVSKNQVLNTRVEETSIAVFTIPGHSPL